jgi:hypothetical protein
VEHDFPAPLLDRALVSDLFGVGKRSAHNLMRWIGARRLGGAYVVGREDLRRWLEAMEKVPEVEWEIRRAARVEESIEEARKYLTARRLAIHADRASPRSGIAGLPRTISFKPGELRIEFHGTEDLLRQLFELSQAVMNDYAKFQELAERAT